MENYLKNALIDESECDERYNGNGIFTKKIVLLGEVDDIPTDIVCDIISVYSGYDYSSNDPQQHVIGNNVTKYVFNCYKNGELIDIEYSGIILPKNYKQILADFVSKL